MKLSTQSFKNKSNSKEVDVNWYVGQQKFGQLTVQFNFDIEDMEIAAELITIQHLMFEKLVFARYPQSGEHYSLKVSKGAIKKIVQGRSDKKHLFPYALFLEHGLRGVNLSVANKAVHSAALDNEHRQHATIVITENDYKDTRSTVDTPALGLVRLSLHAVEQFEVRLDEELKKPARVSLIQRLQNPGLALVELPENVKFHKQRKYGAHDKIEVWRNPTSRFHYVIVVGEDEERTLVTVFTR